MSSTTEFIVHSPETYARAQLDQSTRRSPSAHDGQKGQAIQTTQSQQSQDLQNLQKQQPSQMMPQLHLQSGVARGPSELMVPVYPVTLPTWPTFPSSHPVSSGANTSNVSMSGYNDSPESSQLVGMASFMGSPNDRSSRGFEIVETTGRERGRKRRRTSPTELGVLESEFLRNNKPCKDRRELIAKRLGMEEKNVQIWFQNKRQSCRRQSSQSDSSFNGANTSAANISASSIDSINSDVDTEASSDQQITSTKDEKLSQSLHSQDQSSDIDQPSPESDRKENIAPLKVDSETDKGILPKTSAKTQLQTSSSGLSTKKGAARTSSVPTHSSQALPSSLKANKSHLASNNTTASKNGSGSKVTKVIPESDDKAASTDSSTTAGNAKQDVKGKCVRLTMSADGKAQLVVRSPLKPIYPQQLSNSAIPAKRFASMPILHQLRGEADAECARNLLLLRTSGKW